ncbi:MAG: serine/threonine protein kinase [Myxococcales bacterium]|nr:serine/threonine protein kinase [Myxococcales bacterium]
MMARRNFASGAASTCRHHATASGAPVMRPWRGTVRVGSGIGGSLSGATQNLFVPATGRRRAARIEQHLPTCPDPQAARLRSMTNRHDDDPVAPFALADRLCPTCGTPTSARFCPDDGAPTVSRSGAGDSAQAVQLGEIIADRYRVTGVLGQGGFGQVLAAVHVGTGHAVALKVLHRDQSDEQAVRRFLREAQQTATLQHPHTVRVFDVGEARPGVLYMAMEHVHGRTLAQHLRDDQGQPRACPEAEAIVIAEQVLGSLAEAHARGIVHRDLKPANLMICNATLGQESGLRVKVLDFGIAHVAGSALTGTAKVVGTPAWMSPEQCQGTPLDGRSDLYSLGLVVYRCVTGRVLFEDANPMTAMYRHLHEPVPDPRKVAPGRVSDRLAAWLQKALAKHPGLRFDDASVMRTALLAVQERDAVAPAPTRPSRRGDDTVAAPRPPRGSAPEVRSAARPVATSAAATTSRAAALDPAAVMAATKRQSRQASPKAAGGPEAASVAPAVADLVASNPSPMQGNAIQGEAGPRRESGRWAGWIGLIISVLAALAWLAGR